MTWDRKEEKGTAQVSQVKETVREKVGEEDVLVKKYETGYGGASELVYVTCWPTFRDPSQWLSNVLGGC